MIVNIVLGGVFVIALVSIMGGFLQVRRERLLVHTERMRSLELGLERLSGDDDAGLRAPIGQRSGDDENSPSLSRKCFSTAGWVAFWGFVMAANAHPTGVSIAIAASTGAIGVAGMICGTILAFRTPAAVGWSPTYKPVTEADAIDVVACRG
jgi:hypothetical protein